MSARKVEAYSEAKLLGKAAANWKISDWTGPLAHLMRSKAECFVNVPSRHGSTENIQLRFHLKSYKGHPELQQKFCEQRKDFVHISFSCSCNSCKRNSIKNTADIPEEFLPAVSTRSSGYSLLVDVIKGPKNLALIVSASKLTGESLYASKNNLVIADDDSGRLKLPVVDNFWRILKWTEGAGGKVENCTRTLADKVKEAHFQLTVSAYEVTATGTDAPTLKNLTENQAEEPTVEGVENPIYEKSDVILRTEDGMDIHAHKSILSAKSGFFRETLTENTDTLAVPMDSELLVCFLHWMYKGKWASNYYVSFDQICEAAIDLDMGPVFRSWLHHNLERFFNAAKMPEFLQTVEQYNLKPSADLLKNIEFLRNTASGEKEYERQFMRSRKWDFLQILKEEVDYLKVEISPKERKDTSEDLSMENVASEADDQPGTLTASFTFETPAAKIPNNGASSPKSDSGLSINAVDKQNDNTLESESDIYDCIICGDVKEDKEVEPESAEDIKKLREEMDKLLKRFNQLKHSE